MNKKRHPKLIITCHEYFDEVAIKDGHKTLKGSSHKQTMLPESNKTNEITSKTVLRNIVPRHLFNYDSLNPRVGMQYQTLCATNNDTNKKNILNNISGSDVKRLLCFIEVMYNTMQSLLENVTASNTELKFKGYFGIVIDIERYYRFKKHSTGLIKNIISFAPEELCAVSKNNYLKCFIEQQQCTGFKISISICDYTFSNALTELTTVCNATGDSISCCETTKSPSPCLKDWHFCNITQGYLLRIILRNSNVPTLTVMSKLYFVILLNNAPNHKIEINFKFGGVMVYDVQPVTNILPTIMHWSSAHQIILKNNSCIHKWSDLTDGNDTKSCGSITFAKVTQNDPLIQESFNQDASSDTTEIDILHIILFGDESLDISSQSNTNITVKESTGFSIDSLVDSIVSQRCMLEPDNISVNTVKNRSFRNELHLRNQCQTNSILINVKLWLSKIVGHLHQEDSSINKLCTLKDDYINETMFEATYINGFLKWINRHCENLLSQTFHKNFLKCLGQSIIQLHCGTMLA